MKKMTNERLAVRVSLHTITGNMILSAFKLFAGLFGQSTAMVADAVHSLTDGLSTIAVIVGIKLANRKPDKAHPYGHERFECVAAIILSVVLVFTGAGIGWAGVQTIVTGRGYGETIPTPGFLPLVAAIVSIAVKEAMYWYTRWAAKKVNSGALMADAWHSRSDGLASIGSFAGILGARLGFPILDPLAAIVICLFILKVAVDIFREAVGKMTDKSCDGETEAAIRGVILAQDAVMGIDLLKTRLFGDKIYVDAEISVDGSISLRSAHAIAHAVQDAVGAAFPNVKDCTVHINPAPEP